MKGPLADGPWQLGRVRGREGAHDGPILEPEGVRPVELLPGAFLWCRLLRILESDATVMHPITGEQVRARTTPGRERAVMVETRYTIGGRPLELDLAYLDVELQPYFAPRVRYRPINLEAWRRRQQAAA